LALGLSDAVVQSYAGGIRLDALFIDEGFGSLEQESLDGAIKVLKEQMALRLEIRRKSYRQITFIFL
jgi:exonuclease SbcC